MLIALLPSKVVLWKQVENAALGLGAAVQHQLGRARAHEDDLLRNPTGVWHGVQTHAGDLVGVGAAAQPREVGGGEREETLLPPGAGVADLGR